jgi:hypothetical protein
MELLLKIMGKNLWNQNFFMRMIYHITGSSEYLTLVRASFNIMVYRLHFFSVVV